jgi:hypothetical protein
MGDRQTFAVHTTKTVSVTRVRLALA